MLQLLALGDSYTIGESVTEHERWPSQLVVALEKRGIRLDPPVIIARTGWTTDELAADIERRKPAPAFDLVTLLIGVNNQYRGRDIEGYREEFRGLLRQAVGLAKGRPERVIVVSIPDWGVTPFADGRDRSRIASEIDHFNEVNRDEARQARARYADITGISRRASGEPTLTASDGLHPSAEMYRLWTELVLPEALAALARPNP